ENEDWLDYDVALAMGEGRNFLGNAVQLGIKLQEFYRNNQIQGVRKPKAYKAISELSIPAFLKAKKKQPKVVRLTARDFPVSTDEE
ncbi:hypothetical protein ABTK03_20935, partial [Acinetobacter baumannii]